MTQYTPSAAVTLEEWERRQAAMTPRHADILAMTFAELDVLVQVIPQTEVESKRLCRSPAVKPWPALTIVCSEADVLAGCEF